MRTSKYYEMLDAIAEATSNQLFNLHCHATLLLELKREKEKGITKQLLEDELELIEMLVDSIIAIAQV